MKKVKKEILKKGRLFKELKKIMDPNDFLFFNPIIGKYFKKI